MSTGDGALFSAEEAREASRPFPEWVVEVSEILLFTYGGSRPGASDWWVAESGKPGIAKRTHYLFVGPPGAVLYLACADEEEATWLAGHLHGQGFHPKAAVARRIGQQITCARCGGKRKFWHGVKNVGKLCRPCYREWANWSRPSAEGGGAGE